MSSVCHSNVSRVSCHSYVTRIYSYVTHMSSVCHSYVLICHSHVTRMYSRVIRMSLVCSRMSSSLVCSLMSLVCTRMPSDVTCMWFYHEPFQHVKIQMPCFSLIWSTNFSHMSGKYRIMMDYEKTKKNLGWKSTLLLDKIDSYWLINIGWLADINLFNLMIYLFNHKL